ncbi:SUKH-4 family immunity protein [Streptomyces phyllanthi]|uniref:SUKH-4 family immunity protein n=1 Tax=Streptomyces phyllanthi TaxID=1803180 RepID=A0A5N8WEV4_9ACTN|nr:SUKH-4 family immunity protein [Streptomyces phyllanthi]MPY44715.1 hypothetical protein [Streptomyces phyllanthi]
MRRHTLNFSVTASQIVQAYGLTNVVYFPRFPAVEYDLRTANFLSHVGLPDSGVFRSRMDVEAFCESGTDAITLGRRFDSQRLYCPPESRPWWKLSYFFTSLVALDPKSGKVYAFPEGSMGYIQIHRNVESLVYALIEFRKLEIDHENGVDPEELAVRFKEKVSAFDSIPFADEESQWNLSLEELQDGIW